MAERVEGDRPNVPRANAEHASWCTDHSGEACSSATYNIHGVNVGTWMSVWISDEDLGRGIIPIPAYMGLVQKGDQPATSIYLDTRGLRALAEAATKLADALED